MSLKQEIETWVQALAHYDNNEFEEALRSFDGISDTSKILFNCGVIHATLGEHDKAVECYQRAVRQDNFLAVAYFQQGVSNFLVGDFEEALANFNDTLLYLRGNTFIDYDQLGLKFKLFSCEVLFNRGLCYIYLQQTETGMADLNYAVKEKVTPDHEVIDEAIREQAEGYTVFSIPVGIVYRPNSAKVKNLKTKDYLGKARLIAASDQGNAFTGFAGSEAKKSSIIPPTSGKDDRPPEGISFAASNLVKPGLASRSRQQSEPPVNRNTFPPTPPPDAEPSKPTVNGSASGSAPSSRPAMTGRAASVKAGLRPDPLTLRPKPSAAENTTTSPSQPEKLSSAPRIGTIRTASEPRGPSRKYSSQSNRSKDSAPSARGRLFMEATRGDGAEADIDEYPEELYDMYRSPNRHSGGPPDRRSTGGRRRDGPPIRRHDYISESGEEEDEEDETNASSLSDFEILNNAGGRLSRPPPPRSNQTSSTTKSTRPSSRTRHSSRSRRAPEEPQLKQLRIKVHGGDDTRFVMVGAACVFEDFVDKVRDKFGVRTRFKLKVRDEEDGGKITVGDRDDWEMCLEGVRKEVKKEGGGEMGKLEVWIEEA